jgi:hypothetical protein
LTFFESNGFQGEQAQVCRRGQRGVTTRVDGDDNDDNGNKDSSSLGEEVSFEEEPAWRARSDDDDTTDLENDSIGNIDGSDDDSDNQFSDDAFD